MGIDAVTNDIVCFASEYFNLFSWTAFYQTGTSGPPLVPALEWRINIQFFNLYEQFLMAKRNIVLVAIALLLVLKSGHAYRTSDIVKIKAPTDTPITYMTGYNSSTGQLTEKCVVNKTQKGLKLGSNEPGSSSYAYTRSMEEVLSDQSYDVAVKARVAFGLGKASLGVEAKFAEKMKNRVEGGVALATFSDPLAPEFVDAAATLELTTEAKKWLKAARTSGSKKFARECGDSVIVGKGFQRFFKGMAYFEDSESVSEKQKQLAIQAAVSYMGSGVSASTEIDKKTKKNVESTKMKVEYLTSGDYEGPGATNIRSFAKTFRKFQKAPVAETKALRNIYIVEYRNLLPKSEFDLGLSRKQLKHSNTIINGILLIERARNVARINRNKAPAAAAEARARRLTREYRHAVGILRQNGGCLAKELTRACKNLLARFENYPRQHNRSARKQFVRNATRGEQSCNGYPISRPDGRLLCKKCAPGKEPMFLNGNQGQCRYLTKGKPEQGSKRIFMHNLKVGETVSGGEAGIYTSIASYANVCARPGKDCRGKAAEKICKSKGHTRSTGFEVWNPPNFLAGPALQTHYQNGKTCKDKPGSFNKTVCKPFKYVDCAS